MKRQFKTVVTLAAAVTMTMASVMTASAIPGVVSDPGDTSFMTVAPDSTPTWKQDAKGWWVERPDGSYLVNEWFQSPDSGLWYYMGADGYMLTNTTTPDGNTVNADGVWVQGETSNVASQISNTTIPAPISPQEFLDMHWMDAGIYISNFKGSDFLSLMVYQNFVTLMQNPQQYLATASMDNADEIALAIYLGVYTEEEVKAVSEDLYQRYLDIVS